MPDTSYARFSVDRDALRADFVFDVYSLVQIVPDLDRDADRQLTAQELAARVPDIYQYLRDAVDLEIDSVDSTWGEPQTVVFPPGVGEAIPEQDYHAATSLVHFSFVKELDEAPEDFWVQFRCFEDLSDRHTVLGVIIQDGKEHEVVFRDYEPDYLYDTGYAAESNAVAATPTEGKAEAPAEKEIPPPLFDSPEKSPRSNSQDGIWRNMVSFFWLGVEHIFLGYDHILFLLSLLVVCQLRELIKIVTSFTVAHTITLILATLKIVELPGRWVESAIAATIVYVAVENFWIRETGYRWILTFVFGLIHGFGFAGVLSELHLPTQGMIRSLLAFNVGVEAGQLVIVFVLFPIIYGLTQWKHGWWIQRGISAIIALCGLGWLVDRLCGLEFMPF